MGKRMNPFENYVQQRLASIAMSQDEEAREGTKQAVTVRLQPGTIRLLDAMSKNLEQSRQLFLVELIEAGLHEVVQAYAGSCGDAADEVYRELSSLKSYQEGDL